MSFTFYFFQGGSLLIKFLIRFADYFWENVTKQDGGTESDRFYLMSYWMSTCGALLISFTLFQYAITQPKKFISHSSLNDICMITLIFVATIYSVMVSVQTTINARKRKLQK